MLRVFSLKCQDLSEKPQKGELVKVFEVLKDVPLGSCIFFRLSKAVPLSFCPLYFLHRTGITSPAGRPAGCQKERKTPGKALRLRRGFLMPCGAPAVLGWPAPCGGDSVPLPPCFPLWPSVRPCERSRPAVVSLSTWA